ncbi:unnamed protein product [Meganyctiphanes norvegica]|uniref:C2H2-type domain-containing protein n=1 Tax=Meganyctiphanes norvegica TaxID=48144 RepID=A0AAV2R2R7_MEGNR
MEMSGDKHNLFQWLSVKEEPQFEDCKMLDDVEIKLQDPLYINNVMNFFNKGFADRVGSNEASPGFQINNFQKFHHTDKKENSSEQNINYYQNRYPNILINKNTPPLIDLVKNECRLPKTETDLDMKCINPNWINKDNMLLNCTNEDYFGSADVMEVGFEDSLYYTPSHGPESYEDTSQIINTERDTFRGNEESVDVLNPNLQHFTQLNQIENIVFTCQHCIFSCTKVEILVNHLLRLHQMELNDFICPVCKFKTLIVDEFKRHMSEHTSEQLFDCPCCEYVSSDPGYYELHMENHPGEKGFACLQCSYRARYFRDLQCHIATHNREKVLTCSECDFKCCYKKELKNHMLIHTFEKPFSCSQCPYKCKLKWLLKTHMLIHTGEIQFACSQCDFRCNRKSSLVRHMLIHKRDKPFSCSECDYKCIQKEYMKRHMVIHTGEEPYSCTFCEYKCRYNYNLKKHLLVHGVKR